VVYQSRDSASSETLKPKFGCCESRAAQSSSSPFPARNMTHEALLQQLHGRLKIETDAEKVVTLRTNVSVPRARGSCSYPASREPGSKGPGSVKRSILRRHE
jgi:hypothetical protein